MKPTPDKTTEAAARGGRSAGGTRYYSGKSKGEDTMVRLMQKAIDDKKKQQAEKVSLEDLSVDELISVLEFSCAQTSRLMQEVEKRCFQTKK